MHLSSPVVWASRCAAPQALLAYCSLESPYWFMCVNLTKPAISNQSDSRYRHASCTIVARMRDLLSHEWHLLTEEAKSTRKWFNLATNTKHLHAWWWSMWRVQTAQFHPILSIHQTNFQVLEGSSANVLQQVQDRQHTFILSWLSNVPPTATYCTPNAGGRVPPVDTLNLLKNEHSICFTLVWLMNLGALKVKSWHQIIQILWFAGLRNYPVKF